VYLTCSKKLTGSQLSQPHGTFLNVCWCCWLKIIKISSCL